MLRGQREDWGFVENDCKGEVGETNSLEWTVNYLIEEREIKTKGNALMKDETKFIYVGWI